MGSGESMEWPPAIGIPASAHGLATIQNGADGFHRQHIHRHADNGQRHDGCASHGVDVRQGIGGGNAAKVEGVIHDGHEKVGGGHNGLLVIQAIHRCIITGLGADQQLREHHFSLAVDRMDSSTAGAILQPQPPP
jgi:hypothetical protein